MNVRDMRNAGWCWQEKAALAVLRNYYSGARLKRRATALAIYLVLTEIASDRRDQGRAEATNRALWQATGTSESTVKQYLRELEEAGLIAVERQKLEATINLPNVYILLNPDPGGGSMDRPTGATEDQKTPEGGSMGQPTGAMGQPQLKERNLRRTTKEDGSPVEDDQQFAIRQGRNRKLAKGQALALAAQCTREGQLNRDRFMAALPKG